MENKKNTGFTLLEMMVAISIAMLLMLVVLYDYRTFNDNLALSGAQQEISIAIRQAQVYGLSVRENKVAGSDFTSGYGIYINPSDPTSYYLFVDVQNGINQVNDGFYEGTSDCSAGPSPECVEKDTLRNGVKITNVCGATFGGSMDCSQSFKSINITFIRPNPDASIRFVKSDNSLSGKYQTGQIILTSSLGRTAKVTIENTGQISVQ